MAITPADAPVYTDLAGLTALKRGAASKDPAAIRKVAEQFESMFTSMMLKSMRDANGRDPMFGSDQEQMYQGMFDDQLALQMSHGKGLGLADMLIRQLQKMGVAGADGAGAGAQATASGRATAGGQAGSAQTGIPPTGTTASGKAWAAAYITTQGASAAEQQSFVRTLWPQAQQAGQQLGVDPRSLIAQAALETNWGRSMPQDAAGASSNNLFGMKASRGWAGPSVTAPTQEYQNGAPTETQAQFRAYASPSQSVQDYVALLQNNPRYASALNTGGNVQAFAAGLQRGGYATDPDYARKIGAVAQSVASALSGSPGRYADAQADSPPVRTAVRGSLTGVTDLKSAPDLPITSRADENHAFRPRAESAGPSGAAGDFLQSNQTSGSSSEPHGEP
jgi:peptidoglycan hydrolase FlgJ